ncbi:MAG TPA: helix-turn-helix transcriptional regulator [Trebonia sp.]|nr:helix-turn-helix transcriptional regulator [Trebonia sp.]
MSIGGALAGARQRAGLTVADVSAHTRIRQPIIRAIEHDDFGVCGGDFYARGHIRAIARTVGLDSEPLVHEYDAAHPHGQPVPGQPVTGQPVTGQPVTGQAVTMDDLLGGPPPGDPVPPAQPATHRQSPHRQSPHRRPRHRSAPGAREEQESPRARPRARWQHGQPRRVLGPWGLLTVLLAALAVISFGSYRLVASGGGSQRLASAASTHPAAHPPSVPASQRPGPGRSGAPASPSPSPTPAKAPVRQVTPVSATAYGPGGTSDGDNPQNAADALSGDSSSPWTTDWYTTAQFGNLESGTGLLVDLGKTVTASGVTVQLGSARGADFQVRAGTSQGSLSTVATASGAGGTVTLHLSPKRVRYLVIWFTSLPPDANGTYQAAIYGVTVAAS